LQKNFNQLGGFLGYPAWDSRTTDLKKKKGNSTKEKTPRAGKKKQEKVLKGSGWPDDTAFPGQKQPNSDGSESNAGKKKIPKEKREPFQTPLHGAKKKNSKGNTTYKSPKKADTRKEQLEGKDAPGREQNLQNGGRRKNPQVEVNLIFFGRKKKKQGGGVKLVQECRGASGAGKLI